MKISSLFRKWWVWGILAIAVLLIILSIVSARYFGPWLQDKLITTVHQETKGLYSLRLYGFSASIMGGSVVADSVHLVPDFKVWEQISASGKKDTATKQQSPRTLTELTTKKLEISGLNFIGILRGRPMSVSSLMVIEPDILITEMHPDTTKQQEPLHQTLQGMARELQINRIKVQDGTFRIRQGKNAKADLIALKGFNLDVSGLKLDSASFEDKDRAYYAKSMAFESGKAEYLLPDGTYRLRAGAIKANTEDRTLNVGNLKLIPLLKNAELAQRKGGAATTIKLDIPQLNLSGVNYKLHSRYNNLAVENIIVKNPSVSAYMDRKNFSHKGEKPLPHDLLRQVKTGLTIKKTKVEGMYIRYEELAPDASETGHITFEKLYATITNITNDKSLMSVKKPAVADVKASVNGNAPLAVTIRFNLLDPNGYHTIEGTAGPANPAILNPILEPTTFISISEGKLQKSDFKIELYRNKATGNLNARYSNFKVDILTKDEDKRQSLGKKVLSKVANKVVIKSDNPASGETLRQGEINVTRARSRSVFNYWKDCLVSGFRSAAGIEGFGADLQNPNR